MIVIDGIIFSLQKHGGISTYFNQLTKKIFASGLAVEVMCYDDGPNSKGLYSKLLKKRFIEKLRAINLLNPDSSKPILLHSSYYRYAKNKGVKNVISIYDFIYEKYEKNPIKRNLHIWQKNTAIAHADAVICISESTKDDFMAYYPKFDPTKIYVTHLSYSEDFSFSNTVPHADKFKKPYVVFVGMRSVHKNFDECVKALRDVPDVELLIVGSKDLNQQEMNLLNSNIPNRYQHLKNIDNKQLCSIYEHAVCLLYPSLYEGFGIPILEGMASGCAVITTNKSSIPEVAGNAAVLLDNPISEKLAASIKMLMDQEANKKYVELGFENIKRFSWEKTVQSTIDIYKHILNNN